MQRITDQPFEIECLALLGRFDDRICECLLDFLLHLTLHTLVPTRHCHRHRVIIAVPKLKNSVKNCLVIPEYLLFPFLSFNDSYDALLLK